MFIPLKPLDTCNFCYCKVIISFHLPFRLFWHRRCAMPTSILDRGIKHVVDRLFQDLELTLSALKNRRRKRSVGRLGPGEKY
ncbi:hypothetical protein M413DRAFT_274678 [Hebeloma cylindrosporum]|uniref:Uncharacterized protein n=1 Tax=Hebeloma cylindrosporum TaxID=76867 RepID=A0A0C3BZI3_HEBCY|nr:hypothetical protein M413DRAFT_274678 [Hebeloma cylindrosporum h7]